MKEKIEECIKFLEKNGYEVRKKYLDQTGMWIAFTQEGMKETLHGKIIKDCGNYFHVKCKNGETRYPMRENVLEFFDNKNKCYSYK